MRDSEGKGTSRVLCPRNQPPQHSTETRHSIINKRPLWDINGNPLNTITNPRDLVLKFAQMFHVTAISRHAKLRNWNTVFNFLKRNIPVSLSFLRKKQLFISLVLSVRLCISFSWCPSLTSMRGQKKVQQLAVRSILHKSKKFYAKSLKLLVMWPIA